MTSENITDIKVQQKDYNKSEIFEVNAERKAVLSNETIRILRFGSILQTWLEVSKINYISALAFEDISRDQRLRSITFSPRNLSIVTFDPESFQNRNWNDFPSEQFPIHLTSLMNEDQLWGCFYNFPELYQDAYSPIVRIRDIEDVPPLENGELTRDLVTACLSYLKRSPILGDYVYIKLDLSSRFLINIEVLQYYKYIMYLDLSSNLLTELRVLSYLPYLQYLSVDYNRLLTVLDYDTPQWFLTEVHYKYNSVMTIQNLRAFWSITVLNLSHNNIKYIYGLHELRYLRRLDLSFNHIQRLENLNHLHILWLDVSYNNISSFEFGTDRGLWTLLHLEYLNLNENNLVSMKIFSGCTRLRELHARNNRFGMLLELAVYMQKLRRLTTLDLRSNPVCKVLGYKDVVINSFPLLLQLDDENLEPVEQRTIKMDITPDVVTFATRRLLRLLYVQQLSKARVSPYIPPADSTDVPIVVLVGYEAVGKSSLARRLAKECSKHVELAIRHTTALYHFLDHYEVITRTNFDNMLLTGEFLTYSEMDGESYGLSRREAFVKDGKVKIVAMDLIGALMLKLRGFRPYLILTTCLDRRALANRQEERKNARNLANEKKFGADDTFEISTLQVLLSGRIIINGILNEILQTITSDTKYDNEFVMESECSLLMDSDLRQNREYVKGFNRLIILESSLSTLKDKENPNKTSSPIGSSMYSLYKETHTMDEFVSEVNQQSSSPDKNMSKRAETKPAQKEHVNVRNWEFNKFASTTWKGLAGGPSSRNTSKSVTFNSPDTTVLAEQEPDASGLLVEPQQEKEMENLFITSISAKVISERKELNSSDSDLWLAFLLENKLVQTSEIGFDHAEPHRRDFKVDDDDDVMAKDLSCCLNEMPSQTFRANIKDDYEDIHRHCPGLFWDTVSMDNAEASFVKVKKIIMNIVHSQNSIKPMFDINFANIKQYPIIERKLANICSQIAPQRLFY